MRIFCIQTQSHFLKYGAISKKNMLFLDILHSYFDRTWSIFTAILKRYLRFSVYYFSNDKMPMMLCLLSCKELEPTLDLC